MTISSERTRAVQWARDFLRRLMDKRQTKRVPEAVREEARRVLRHFPDDWHLATMAAGIWATPEHHTAHGFIQDQPDAYLLKITPEQARIIQDACELYGRIGMGQFEEIEHMARMGLISNKDDIDWRDIDYEGARVALERAKAIMTGMPPNAHFGINGKIHDAFRVAFDIQQVVRKRLSWDRRGNPAKREWTGEDSMWGVHYDAPHQFGKEPLATMERASDADILSDLADGFAISRKSTRQDDQEWHLFDMRGEQVKWVASGESARAMVAMSKDAPWEVSG